MQERHIRLWIYFFTIIIAFWWIGCAKKVVTDEDIVATWGDTAVTVADFKNKMYVRYRNEPTAKKQTMKDRMKILLEYVERDLKLAEGRRLGYDKREDIKKRYDESIEQKATELLYNSMVRNRLFTEKEVKDFFEHDREEIRVRHILILPFEIVGDDTFAVVEEEKININGKNKASYWTKAKEKAEGIYKKAKSGDDFKKLVDRYSEDDSIDRKHHGDIGFFKWGKMVDEFQEAAWELKPGKVSPPVRTRYGWHIIKMIERRSRGFQVNTSHILVKCTRRADPAESTAAWERAIMILKEAQKPGADFAQLARRYSEDDNTWVNGIVGYIPRGSMPSDYWDKAFKMKPDQVDGPVRSYKGYHIIKMHESQTIEKSLDDPDVRERIYSSMARIKRDTLKKLAEFYLDSLKKVNNMEYNEEVVNLLLHKLNDQSTPSNMNRFSSFTSEERELNVVDDRLGGVKIEDLVQQYGDNAFPPQYRQDRDFIVEMVEPLVIPKYLAEIARDMGYFDKPEAKTDSKRSLDNAILPEIEREMVFNKATPSEKDIEKYFEKNISKYTRAPTASIYEIMVNDRQFAQDLYDRIKKGEDISKLARQYTQRKKAKRRGGKLENITSDQYGPVSRKAFKLEVGELAGPIEMNDKNKVYSIIKLIEKKPEYVQTLDEARKQIESDLRFKRQKEIKEAWISELKKSFDLKIYKDVVKNVWPLIDPLPEPMVEERKQWKNERKLIGERGKIKRKEESEIKLKLKPGSTQTFKRDGKNIEVKIGQPRYAKDGKDVDPSKSKIKISPKGKGSKSSPPVIKLQPKKKGTDK